MTRDISVDESDLLAVANCGVRRNLPRGGPNQKENVYSKTEGLIFLRASMSSGKKRP